MKPPNITCIKTSFGRLFNDQHPKAKQHLANLQDYLRKVHLLSEHITHALKYVLLTSDMFKMEALTKEHVEVCCYLLNKGKSYQPRNPTKLRYRKDLLDPISGYLKLTRNGEHIALDNEQQTINYLTTSVFNNLKVNIQQCFVRKLLSYITYRLQVKKNVSELKTTHRDADLKEYVARVRRLKNIFMFSEIPDEQEFDSFNDLQHEIWEETYSLLPPQAFSFSEGLEYDVMCNPMDYLIPYMKLADLYETHGLPLFNFVPLRKTYIQPHVRIDTMILVTQILGLKRKEYDDLVDKKYQSWSRFFRLERKEFAAKKNRNFEGSITTDGISVSIYFCDNPIKYGTFSRRKSKASLLEEVKKLYFENHVSELQTSNNIVVIDPNKRDLLFCQDVHGRTFRYTSMRRRRETRSAGYAKQRERLKGDAKVEELESNLKSSKTVGKDRFLEYLEERKRHRAVLTEFYRNPLFLRKRWHAFMNKQKTESRLINDMREKFGTEFHVVMGDWDDGGRTLKFQQSSKTKGFRTLFARNHLTTYLVDEYKTSSICVKCHGPVVKNSRERPSSRPWRRQEGKTEKVHGLLGCNNLKCKQTWSLRYYNRDMLSTCNMRSIVETVMSCGHRPKALSR